MANGNPNDPFDGYDVTDDQDGGASAPAAPGGSHPVDDALATFASTLAAMSDPGSDPVPGSRPSNDTPVPSSFSSRKRTPAPQTSRSIDDLLSGFQSTLASLPGESATGDDKPASPSIPQSTPKAASTRPTTRPTTRSTTSRTAGAKTPAASSDAAAAEPSWRERLAAASAAVETPAPAPAAELPDFLKPRGTTRGRASSKAATPAPTPAPTPAATPEPAADATPSWRERLAAASASAAAPMPAAELPDFLRPRGDKATSASASATERLAKLLADTKTFDETEPEAAPVVEPEPVSEEPVIATAPVGGSAGDFSLAADLSVDQPVEPVVEPAAEEPPAPVEPAPTPSVRRRPSMRRQVKGAATAEPTELAQAEPVGWGAAALVEPEVAEPAVAEPEVVEPVAPVEAEVAEPVADPITQELPVVEPEQVEEEPVVEPVVKPRGRRKGSPVVPVPVPAEPEEAAEADDSEGQVVVPVAAAAAVADEKPGAQTTAQEGSWWDEQPGDDDDEDEDIAEKPAKPRQKWSRSSLLLLLLAILLVVGAAVTGGIYWYKQAHTPTFLDMNGNKVVPDDNSVFDPAYVQAADAQPDLGQRFKVPSVNLDVPLGSVNQVDGLINPPGYTSVYWVKNMGVSPANADKGTVYVVTHSVKSPGTAPGDFLIDQSTVSVIVQKGAEIDVGDRKYTVDSSLTVSKDELGSQTSLWAGTPGMLVLITCMQGGTYLPNGHSATNVVIIGTLVS